MTGVRDVTVAIGLSLVLHAGLAAGLRAIGLGPWAELEALPPLFVDLVEPIVAVSESRPPGAPPSPRRPVVAAEPPAEAPTRAESRPASPASPAVEPAATPPTVTAPPPPPPAALESAPVPSPIAAPPAPPVPPDPAPSAPAPPSSESASAPPALAVAAPSEPAAPVPASVPEPVVDGGASGGRPETRAPAPPAPVRVPEPVGMSGAGISDFGSETRAPTSSAKPDSTTGVAGEGTESSGQGSVTRPPGPPVDLAAAPDGRAVAIPPEYDAYVRALRRRIQERLAYPWLAVRRGLEGTIELEVRIDAGGRLAGVATVSPEGPAVLRDAAMGAVRDATPFPFPPGLAGRALTMRLPVVFQLK